MSIFETKLKVYQPKCYLRLGDKNGPYTIFHMPRDFNWLQRKMLKWCFGLEYIKDINEL